MRRILTSVAPPSLHHSHSNIHPRAGVHAFMVVMLPGDWKAGMYVSCSSKEKAQRLEERETFSIESGLLPLFGLRSVVWHPENASHFPRR